MQEFYGSRTASSNWYEDTLGRDVLLPGQSVRIDFDDGTGHCVFDFKAVFNDGEVLISNEVNVCEVETYTYD